MLDTPLRPTPDPSLTRNPTPAVPWTARAADAAGGRRTVVELLDAGQASNSLGAVLLPLLLLATLFVAGTSDAPVATAEAGADAGIQAPPAPGDEALTAAAAPPRRVGAPAPPTVEEGAPVRFASFEDLELFLPSRRALLSGFHEASYPHALRMRPWGTPVANDNLRKDAVAPEGEGPNYAIMSTRGRPTHATSAVDVAVPHHAPIASPVTGTVVEVRPYTLYGRYADTRISVRPATRPDLVVTVLHVSDPKVRVGDEVAGGRTHIAGRATSFPFASHVDAYAGGRPPHVHLELKRG